ncbi:hypothetical protein GCM10007937_26690 [Mesorhizobium albiziae]|nr:hypothetical protein GCM10007937_26690 [Mesorhizobium albiziae]
MLLPQVWRCGGIAAGVDIMHLRRAARPITLESAMQTALRRQYYDGEPDPGTVRILAGPRE